MSEAIHAAQCAEHAEPSGNREEPGADIREPQRRRILHFPRVPNHRAEDIHAQTRNRDDGKDARRDADGDEIRRHWSAVQLGHRREPAEEDPAPKTDLREVVAVDGLVDDFRDEVVSRRQTEAAEPEVKEPALIPSVDDIFLEKAKKW